MSTHDAPPFVDLLRDAAHNVHNGPTEIARNTARGCFREFATPGNVLAIIRERDALLAEVRAWRAVDDDFRNRHNERMAFRIHEDIERLAHAQRTRAENEARGLR